MLGTVIVMLLKCLAIESGFDGSAAARKTFIMTKKLIGLVAMIAVIGSSATLFAQEGTSQQTPARGR